LKFRRLLEKLSWEDGFTEFDHHLQHVDLLGHVCELMGRRGDEGGREYCCEIVLGHLVDCLMGCNAGWGEKWEEIVRGLREVRRNTSENQQKSNETPLTD
jgi:hypothetical protein